MSEEMRKAAIATAVLFMTVRSSLADPLTVKDLEGAWLADGTACEQIFLRTDGKLSIRKPLNQFVAGFIIDGDRLQTPLSSCRIRRSMPLESGVRLEMTCTNSMSTASVVATLRFGRAGMLERIDDGNPATSYYNRCTH